ncbi:MAG: hypothetical protein EPN88_07950 [Bacteroidetes bacterium]|nr:MAG: hypothetical protein EPN88_07950 [Bacteroidota bacterium]
MKKMTFILALCLLIISCNSIKKADQVYRYYMGKKDNYDIWIVDGNQVRLKIFSSFLYGGNEQRYPFNPKGEIWIDNAISCEEYYLTLAHELNERHLMAKFGWKYITAHDSSLSLEQTIRHSNEEICRSHEATITKVVATGYDNIKEIKSLPDSIRLQNIYRIPMGSREGIDIWIVDGYMIRKNVYPDFGFSGNDLSYHFIPPKEIWIDGQVSCEETEYSIMTELKERTLIDAGKSYDDAYSDAIDITLKQRQIMEKLTKSHFKIAIPDSITRYAGTIDPDEK